VRLALERLNLSQRRSCALAGISRSVYRYRPRCRDDVQLRKRLRELAAERPRFGLPRLIVLLHREGFSDNHKRIERIYREEGLKVRRKKRKRVARADIRRVVVTPSGPNQRWSIDFMHDYTASRRTLKVLTMVDDYSKRCPHLETAYSIDGRHVVRVLEALARRQPLPREIVLDHGPEFAGLALDQWAHRRGVHLRFIRPGKPIDNCFIESFNGRFRDECLNQYWFLNLEDAKRKIEDWRIDYNRNRPHSALGQLSPEEFLIQQKLQAVGGT
jgi:putative transposase